MSQPRVEGSAARKRAVQFAAPPALLYGGGCSTEPAWYALEWLLNWRGDVWILGRLEVAVPVAECLRELLRRPAEFGLTREEAQQGSDLFLEYATPLLESMGGQRAWLEDYFSA